MGISKSRKSYKVYIFHSLHVYKEKKKKRKSEKEKEKKREVENKVKTREVYTKELRVLG